MKNSIYKRLIKLVFNYWPYLVLSTATAFVYVALNGISVWLTASLINNILSDFDKLILEQSRLSSSSILTLNEKIKYFTNELILRDTAKETLQMLCYSILIIFVLKNVFLYLKNVSLIVVQYRLITELRNKLYIHFHSLSLSFFNKQKSGELTSIIVNDVANMRQALTIGFQRMFVEPINIIAFTTLLFIISWQLASIAVIIIPLAGFVIVKISRSIRRKSRRTAVKIAGITNIITETLASIRVVKAFAMENYEVDRFTKETNNYYNLMFRRSRLRSIAPPITEILGVVIGVALLWIGGSEVLAAEGITSEDFIRFILIMFSALQPIRSLSNVFAEIQVGAASAERVFHILDTNPTIIDADNAIKDVVFNEHISFDNVSFQYEHGESKVLKEIDFSIKKGSIVALVGASGSGKSTIADRMPTNMLTDRDNETRIIPRARANSKLPTEVSRDIAVVNVLVYPRIFPPTIIANPISENALPNPIRTAAQTPYRRCARRVGFRQQLRVSQRSPSRRWTRRRGCRDTGASRLAKRTARGVDGHRDQSLDDTVRRHRTTGW